MKKIVLSLVVAGTALMAADGAALFKKCIACHGAHAEKKALNKSEIIAEWDAAKMEEALKGYKEGKRNAHGMGMLMKGQIATYSEEDIKAVCEYIDGLN